jgi:hypothetical protein
MITKLISGNSGSQIFDLKNESYILNKEIQNVLINNEYKINLPKETIIYNLKGGVFAKHKDLLNFDYISNCKMYHSNFGIRINKTKETIELIEKNSTIAY